MNADDFIREFSHIANAPKGVERIRNLILRFAVRGQLISSETRDLDASIDFPVYAEFSQPTDLPAGWLQVPFGKIGEWRGGGTPSKANPGFWNGTIPWVSPKDMKHHCISETHDRISEEAVSKSSTKLIPPGSILIVIRGMILIHTFPVAYAGCELTINQDMKSVIPAYPEIRDFLLVVLNAYQAEVLDLVERSSHGTCKLLTKDIQSFLIPLPPLDEQQRIVAKVDELMGLCDRLESQLAERAKLLPLLSQANHARFVTKPTPSHLQAIFLAEGLSSPIHLRDSILSLAFKGLIVRQDESDQPAEELLKDIQNDIKRTDERRASNRAKKIQRVESSPFPLPFTWKWVRLGAIAEAIEYGTSHKADSIASGIPVYRMGDIQSGELRNDNLKYVPREIDDLPSLYLQPGDILFNRTNSAELVGKAAIFRGTPDTHTFASYLIRLRFPNEFVNAEYVNFCLLSPYFRATQIAPELTQQCGQANFNGTKLANTLLPLPPKSEQARIVLKVKGLMEIVHRLETMQAKVKLVASDFALTTIALLTGTSNTETMQMKPPKTKVVTALKVGNKPTKAEAAPLATILSEQKTEASAKSLWQLSGLEIDAFYRQLKTEMANGWITEPEKATVKEVEVG